MQLKSKKIYSNNNKNEKPFEVVNSIYTPKPTQQVPPTQPEKKPFWKKFGVQEVQS